jgi:hypothetical protein
MIPATPAQERYTKFSCPNPACQQCNRPHGGNIVHRSWTGKHKQIERRRTRCLSWSRPRHRGRVWLLVSLYNFVMPHNSLRQGRTPRTPAMALGLTDHVWSYREYIWLPVHRDPILIE